MSSKIAEGLVAPPQQERSRRTLERILAAGERVLISQDLEFTIQNVAVVGKLSVGGIYARFAGKHELLYALKERVLGRQRAHIDAALQAVSCTSTREVFDTFMHALSQDAETDARVQNRLFDAARTFKDLSVRGRAGRAELFELLLAAIRRVPGMDRPELEPYISFSYEMILASWLSRIRDHYNPGWSWSRLGGELATAAALYLEDAAAHTAPPR